jgi:hypothetical protein
MPVLNSSEEFKNREIISEKSRKFFLEKHELESTIFDYVMKLNSGNVKKII